MSGVQFVKSFSRGQITIPKKMRQALALGDDFWLKLELQEKKLVATPVEYALAPSDYAKMLLTISGGWFDATEWKRIRARLRRRLQRRERNGDSR